MTGLFSSNEPKPKKYLKDQIFYQSSNILVIDLREIDYEDEDIFKTIDNFLSQGYKFLYKKSGCLVFQKPI